MTSLRLSPTREQEIVEELSQHLEERWQELVAGGLSEAEATERALAGFQSGDLLARELGRLRQAHTAPAAPPGVPGGRLLADLGQDVRHAWRLLRRRPGFTVAATLTLAFAIGANTAIFSLVDAVLLRTLPVERPDRLVLIEQNMARGGTQNLSRPLFEHLRDAASVFAGVCAAQDGYREMVMGAGDGAQTVTVQAVSGEYFDVLGTTAFIGRVFGTEDDRTPGAHPVAVVSHAFWWQRLGADPHVVGRAIPLAGQPFTVVGVARPGFFGEAVGSAPEIWVPMMMHPALNAGRSLLDEPRTGWLTVVARLWPEVTRQQADAALAVVLNRLKADPGSLGGMPPLIAKLAIVDGRQGKARLREQFSLPLLVLSGAMALLLLIACANVATMLLARASARQREIAIRTAIGADRRRLVRQLLTENLLLAAIGGALGLALSWWGSRLLLVMAGQMGQPIDIDVTPDLRLLAFNAVVSVGAVMIFGLAPALTASRADVPAVMKTMPGRRLRQRLSPLLVVAQVALSLPLVAGAGLLLQTLHNLRTRDLGFAADSLVQVRTNPEASGYTPDRLPALTSRMIERLDALPGVRAVSVSHSGFGTGTSSTCCIAIPGRVFASEGERDVRMIGVGPNYFSTVGQRLRIGRDFVSGDLSADPSARTTVAIVNDAFVRQFLPAGSPIGQHFGWGDPPKVSYDIEVVGVVDDAVYDDVRAAAKPLIYFPSATGRLYVVRAQGAPANIVGSLRRELQAIDPALVVTVVAPVMEEVERALVRETLLARLSGVFGLAAAALAGLGLYGLLAFAVASRTRDIGVCMALGAPRDRIMRAEVWWALRLVAIGLALGLPAALAAGRLIAAQLYDVSAADPVALAAAAVLLIALGGLAAYGPARRASRVDPILALRAE